MDELVCIKGITLNWELGVGWGLQPFKGVQGVELAGNDYLGGLQPTYPPIIFAHGLYPGIFIS